MNEEREKGSVAKKDLSKRNLSGNAEVRRRIELARRYRFPWLLIIMILIVFLLIFFFATYFSG